ncbi:MAG: hypothetical protein IKU10_03100 [Clostridia bacterium]|nr:hypothetical protein [Clostridia bacterium]
MKRKTWLVAFLLCFLLALSVGCSKPVPTIPPMNGFMIQPGLVMVKHPTNDSTVLAYAAETTVNGFFASVTANEGFRIALLDELGKEVTDPNTLLTDQMTFVVYEQNSQIPQVEFPLQVADPVEVRRHYSNVAQ